MLTKNKIRQLLIDTGRYIDNNFLDLYIEFIFTKIDNEATNFTEAHHVIPAQTYLSLYEKYNRKQAVKLANADKNNFIVNLSFSEHHIVHAYLDLCTNWPVIQRAVNDKLRDKYKTTKEERTHLREVDIALYYDKKSENKQLWTKVCDRVNELWNSTNLTWKECVLQAKQEIWLPAKEVKHIKKTFAARCWVNDGKEQKKVYRTELIDYLNAGWVKGTLRKKY